MKRLLLVLFLVFLNGCMCQTVKDGIFEIQNQKLHKFETLNTGVSLINLDANVSSEES
jgi:hypothetical protein